MADISKIKLPDDNEYDIKDTIARAHYCVCSTAAGTAEKTADLPGFVLETGAWVIVRFTNTNTAGVGSLTLSINGTTAAAIKYKNASLIEKGALAASKMITFVYDGTYWQIVGDVDQPLVQYGFGYTTCSTAASTAAKTASLSNYLLVTNGIVVVRFENDVNAGATLNINNKGAKAIYYQNAAITDGIIKAGDTVTFIYSTYYRIISIDRDKADRDALIELVDNGAKNALHYDGLSSVSGDVTFTLNADNSITVNGTTTDSTSYVYLNLNNSNVNAANLCNGTYVLSGCPTNSSGLSLQVRGTDYTKSETGDGVELTTYSGSGVARVTIMVAKNSTINNLTVRPMICSKAAWNISHTYQPYRPSYQELYDKAGKLGYSIETVTFSSLPTGTSWSKTSGGIFYTNSTIDVSDKFDVLYSATLNDFGNIQGNLTVVPYIKPGTARFGLWVVDPTNPQDLPMIASTMVKVALFGILKNPT